MKKLTLFQSLLIVLVMFLGVGVTWLVNGFEESALASKAISEPFNILFIGFGLIALGSFLKKGFMRSE